MNEILRNVDWESTLGGLDVNDSWGYFKSVYQDAIDKCVPKYKSKLRKKLWMTSDALQLKRSENKLWNLKGIVLQVVLVIYWTTRQLITIKLRQLTCNLRRDYEKDLAMNIGSKPKAFWKYRVKTRPTIDELYKSDGTFTSEHSEMVNLFNDYFCRACVYIRRLFYSATWNW